MMIDLLVGIVHYLSRYISSYEILHCKHFERDHPIVLFFDWLVISIHHPTNWEPRRIERVRDSLSLVILTRQSKSTLRIIVIKHNSSVKRSPYC